MATLSATGNETINATQKIEKDLSEFCAMLSERLKIVEGILAQFNFGHPDAMTMIENEAASLLTDKLDMLLQGDDGNLTPGVAHDLSQKNEEWAHPLSHWALAKGYEAPDDSDLIYAASDARGFGRDGD